MIRLPLLPQLCLALALAFAGPASFASDRDPGGTLKRFERVGPVEKINSTEVILNGEQFRFSSPPTILGNSIRKTLSQISPGDILWVKGRVLIGVRYIDTMTVLPDTAM